MSVSNELYMLSSLLKAESPLIYIMHTFITFCYDVSENKIVSPHMVITISNILAWIDYSTLLSSYMVIAICNF